MHDSSEGVFYSGNKTMLSGKMDKWQLEFSEKIKHRPGTTEANISAL